jgi:hypothetical protein
MHLKLGGDGLRLINKRILRISIFSGHQEEIGIICNYLKGLLVKTFQKEK